MGMPTLYGHGVSWGSHIVGCASPWCHRQESGLPGYDADLMSSPRACATGDVEKCAAAVTASAEAVCLS